LFLLTYVTKNITLYHCRMMVTAANTRPDNVVVADIDGLWPDDLYQGRCARRGSYVGSLFSTDTANLVWLSTGGLGTVLFEMLLKNAVHHRTLM